MLNKSILVVEDSSTERQAIVKILNDHGHRTLSAQDGKEAMRVIEQDRPSLVLLDVVMPGPSGFQVCRSLKKDPATQDIKVIIVSSKGNDSDRFWGFKQGADDYIKKPYTSDEIISAVRKHLN